VRDRPFQLAAGLRPASDLSATRIAEWNLALTELRVNAGGGRILDVT